MSLTEVARSTLAIVAEGGYQAPSGKRRDLRAAIDAAVSGTRLYPHGAPDPAPARAPTTPAAPAIEVWATTTAEAARRLSQDQGVARVAALNFASARNPGGGFLGGAKAQEEDLARCSALYTCQLTQPAYYDDNRRQNSMLYLDHILYSPAVPFFRGDDLTLLEEPYRCSILTAPAPNAGEALRRDPAAGPAVSRALRQRAGKVLAIAAAEDERCLVLGAWGCGVFRNDPGEVAAVFADALAEPRLRGAFDRIVFAIFDRSREQGTLAAFQRRFSAA